jgi:hypothetical protein
MVIDSTGGMQRERERERERRFGSYGKTAQTATSASRWSHFWRLLRDLEEAMDTSAVDMLHRRISMLEREVAEIKANQPREREIEAEDDRAG